MLNNNIESGHPCLTPLRTGKGPTEVDLTLTTFWQFSYNLEIIETYGGLTP